MLLLIEALNRALQALIKENINRVIKDIDVKFDPPSNDFKTGKPTVNVFLYDIRENLDLRTHKSINIKSYQQGEPALLQNSPTHVSFSYILTAWANNTSDSNDTSINDVDKILSLLLYSLLSYSELPEELLDDSIKNVRPLPKIQILHPTYLQGIGEFWNALQGQPKPLIHCSVTVPVYPNASPVSLIQKVITLTNSKKVFIKGEIFIDFNSLHIPAKNISIEVQCLFTGNAFFEIDNHNLLIRPTKNNISADKIFEQWNKTYNFKGKENFSIIKLKDIKDIENITRIFYLTNNLNITEQNNKSDIAIIYTGINPKIANVKFQEEAMSFDCNQKHITDTGEFAFYNLPGDINDYELIVQDSQKYFKEHRLKVNKVSLPNEIKLILQEKM